VATGLAAIVVYKDEIAEVFGFADEAPKKLDRVTTSLQKNAKQLQKLTEIGEVQLETAKKFVKTTKKELVPNLKNLDEMVGTSAKALKSLRGREGFGGLLEAITHFFINADLLFKDYFGYILDTTESKLDQVLYTFEETLLRLDNVTVFIGNRIRNSFARVMGDIDREIKGFEVTVPTIFVPESVFSFERVEGASSKLNRLVDQINAYSVATGRQTQRAVYAHRRSGVHSAQIYWQKNMPSGLQADHENDLSYDVPRIDRGGDSTGRSSGLSSPGARQAAGQDGAGGGVEVNIYDGTGQRIDAYNSSIRVEIKERSNRLGMIPALNVSGV
jgi:hypothetical protein